MSDLVPRPRIHDGKVRDGGERLPPNSMDEILAGAFAVGEENRALKAEIERLTAERDAALAKLARYEQAPVKGWLADDGRISSDETKRTAMAKPSRDAFHIPLIARPEATHDST